jgi:hypothetical protein
MVSLDIVPVLCENEWNISQTLGMKFAKEKSYLLVSDESAKLDHDERSRKRIEGSA